MSDLPAPLVASEVDLRDFSWMPVEIHRLRRSKAWLLCKRRPELAFYMLNLWTASWHDTPAGSLEDDDDVLADLAMCDPAKWAKLREQVLRGWVKCSDGRLYHPVVADKATEAWTQKQAQRQRTEAARQKRLSQQQAKQHGLSPPPTEPVTDSVTDHVTESNGTEQTGQGTDRERNGQGTEIQPVSAAAPPPPSAADAAVTTAKRGQRLPEEWQLPKPWGEWALAKYPHWTADTVRDIASKFRNHWVAKTGKDATKLDWKATWENWVDSGITQRDHPKPGGQAMDDDFMAEARKKAGLSPQPETVDA